MQNSPLISVIIPIYNVEPFLKQCLESVLNQTYENLEVICVNDQSPDRSLDILNDYAKRDERIKIVDRQENGGLSAARNSGMEVATGEYTMFLDGDDWIDTDTYEITLKAALENDADYVMFSYMREFGSASLEKIIYADEKIIFDEQKCVELCRRMVGPYGIELSHPENVDAISTACCKLYKTELFKTSGAAFIDTKEIGTEDALFNLHCLYFAKKAVFIKHPFYHYRKTNTASLTSTYKPELFPRWQKLFDKMADFIHEKNCGPQFEVAHNNRIALSIIGLGFNIMDSDKGLRFKIRELKKILNNPRYREAYKNLDFKHFPPHWKVFFALARYRAATLLVLMLRIINIIRKKDK